MRSEHLEGQNQEKKEQVQSSKAGTRGKVGGKAMVVRAYGEEGAV